MFKIIQSRKKEASDRGRYYVIATNNDPAL